MDLRKIKKLIELIQKTGVAEIEISEQGESVRITREVRAQAQQPIPTFIAAPTQPAQATAQTTTPPPKTESSTEGKHTLKAPMVGTVYLSATPGAKSFVEIGQTVKTGDVVCLIEAMKMFNQIEADKTGTITARLVDNGTPVEFNQPLFIIE